MTINDETNLKLQYNIGSSVTEIYLSYENSKSEMISG